jgi:hypothetical protein
MHIETINKEGNNYFKIGRGKHIAAIVIFDDRNLEECREALGRAKVIRAEMLLNDQSADPTGAHIMLWREDFLGRVKLPLEDIRLAAKEKDGVPYV